MCLDNQKKSERELKHSENQVFVRIFKIWPLSFFFVQRVGREALALNDWPVVFLL